MVEDGLRPVHLPPAQAGACAESERLRAWPGSRLASSSPSSRLGLPDCSTFVINAVHGKKHFKIVEAIHIYCAILEILKKYEKNHLGAH